MSYKEVFTNIYENFGFGSTESRSGPGSTLQETESLRNKIVELVKQKKIKTVVDIPCGDFHWMKEIVHNFESYIGGDIVPEAIELNNETYRTDKVKFFEFDLLKNPIPKADLLIIRDVIGHFPLDDGLKIVDNILNSECEYLLSTTWAKKIDGNWSKCDEGSIDRENEGVDYGRFYPVNLMSEPFNLPEPEEYLEEETFVHNYEKGNRKVLGLWNLSKLKKELKTVSKKSKTKSLNKENTAVKVDNIERIFVDNKNITIVSGLWDISRSGRNFKEHYLPRFEEFLQIPVNMVLFLPKDLHQVVWKYRDKVNTFVKEFELEDVRKLYSPHWDSTQKIRTDEKWLNITGEGGWLTSSPQAVNEWYNPIVQSKMFMLHDASIWNPFSTEYFYWLDAGITNTVPSGDFIHSKIMDKLPEYSKPFLFLSYPYQASNEIHGFEFNAINKYAGSKVEYVCRGGLFGGHKEQISEANATYYSLLQRTLQEGYMGTEESIFTIMSYNEPELYRRYMLDGNGLIVKFTQAVIENNVTLEEPTRKVLKPTKITKQMIDGLKTNLYMLTFNFPEQVLHTVESMKKTPEWLEKPKLFLLDNSTDKKAKKENKKIAKEYNFKYIDLKGNKGINGGRQAAAEHFHKSDADFMFFFEDDMTSNPPEFKRELCRNGLRKYVPNLYTIVHKIMLKENFDFLKLSFTEVYMDNNIQVSWYNVPQHIRTRDWPDYDKLPVTGLDPNAPRTIFNHINVMDGLSYISGEIYYANWPMIVSKEGNRKMFIETTWEHPYEQTWMSHMYQKTKEGYIKPAVLLASPILHDRIKHYKPEERREN